MSEITHTAVGTWSGGRFMHFGQAIDDERLVGLLRPDDGIRTVLTADAYGAGDADLMLGRALSGLPRDSYAIAGAIGHDFYEGQRAGAKGFPRFTDPSLRAPGSYASYLQMATERSLERCGVDHFDLLMLHNPDHVGYTSEEVWDAMSGLRERGLTNQIGIAPGPANGFTLDMIDCFERFGDRIDWAMVILNPLEPWPGELCLAAAQRYDVKLITRVVDYGGLFHGDLRPGSMLADGDHRSFRPDGWIERGCERIDKMAPIADRHGLTILQLACQWNLAHSQVACVAPTLVQEAGDDAIAVEAKRADLAGVPAKVVLSDAEVAEIRAIGDNSGSMALKGGAPDYEGAALADRWPLTDQLVAVAAKWGIDPQRDLVQTI